MPVSQFGNVKRNGAGWLGQLRHNGRPYWTNTVSTDHEAAKQADRRASSSSRPSALKVFVRLPFIDNCGPYTGSKWQLWWLRRLRFKLTGSEDSLQVGLTDEEKQWLQEHSLEDLQEQFKRAGLKRCGKAGRSWQYRGVSARDGKWRAQLRVNSNGVSKHVLRKMFDTEQDAARAYDYVTLQHNGRCTTCSPFQVLQTAAKRAENNVVQS